MTIRKTIRSTIRRPYYDLVKPGSNFNPFFTTVWNTELAGSANNTIIIPTSGSGYDANINWGDGNTDRITGTPGPVSHVYDTPGIKTVNISGVFPRIRFENSTDKLKLIDIKNWGNIVWDTFVYAFDGCINLIGTYKDYPRMQNVTSTYRMFAFCQNFNGITTNWDTRKVETMYGMYFYCFKFNQQLHFDTVNVTNMQYMLLNCYVFDQNVNFDVRKVTTMNNMFGGNYKLSTKNYDAIINSIASQDVLNNVSLGADQSKYSIASKTARDTLISKGWSISDAGQSSFDKGKLVLSFDDGTSDFYNVVAPLLKGNGVRGTVYVIASAVNTVGKLSWSMLEELENDNFDIECHTYNHSHLTTLSETEVKAEYTLLNDAFTANGITPPQHTAYPYGEQNANVQTWTATLRSSARAVGDGLIEKSTNLFALPCYTMTETAHAEITRISGILNDANRKYSGVILYGHAVDVIGNMSSSQLLQIIDYAKSIGMDIVTHKELYSLMQS